jgi:uncharacterized protein YggE
MKTQLAFLLVAIGVCGHVEAQAINGAPFVAVHGTATRQATPDLFPLRVTLSETSTDPATQARIESLAAGILASTDRMKVGADDLSIQNLSISPDYTYDNETSKQVFLGNTYERQITVTFHTLDALRKFIAGLPNDQAVRIDTENFKTSHARELRGELLREAIADARSIAEALAAGAGRKLGPVHTISNQAFNVSYSDSARGTRLYSGAVLGAVAPAPAPPPPPVLREGRITLDQDVYIIYALE